MSTQQALSDRYVKVRAATEALAAPLSAEDCCVQSMPDVSPTKWHLAHVTWFFETFVLRQDRAFRPFHERFEYLFNSYYNAVGEQYPRPRRGLLTRPSLGEVLAYRAHVDEHMIALLTSGSLGRDLCALIELGLNHEQQHQELALMDIKHVLFANPLRPVYSDGDPVRSRAGDPTDRVGFAGGTIDTGAVSRDGFCFDNETPRHQRLITPFALGATPVRNRDYLAFMDDRGYQTPALWLADGWARVDEDRWRAPLYWVRNDEQWFEFTLHGLRPLDLDAPVVHVSLFEADAFASWAGARLPTEFEWEHAASEQPIVGHFADDAIYHPAAGEPDPFGDLFGSVWEWTRSAYEPYPGFRAAPGAVGEYNGKFMCNQQVMRGGACVTPSDHVRASYRNFFYPHMRWQFGGIRLAFDG